MKKSFLAGSSRAEFFRRHWQKKPLLARKALREYSRTISRDDLFSLASRADIESRIVTRTRGRWRVRHGPFAERELERMPRSGWTLLVHGVEVALPQAARLLRAFDFVPYARLDDLMVSYAVPGGGVGPHFDSYDVFLVQSQGERRWRVSRQKDLELVPDAPLKILKRFVPEQEWTLSTGDVLYLPPRYAHDGIAVSPCITCSVGFRAPQAQELASRFLEFLQDGLALSGRYADPNLTAVRRPARLPADLVDYAAAATERIRWSREDVSAFLGSYLSEPKDSVTFERPRHPAALGEFKRQAGRRGLALSSATRMLFHGARIFINGEMLAPGAALARACARLADARELEPPLALPEPIWPLLYEWYLAGYIALRA